METVELENNNLAPIIDEVGASAEGTFGGISHTFGEDVNEDENKASLKERSGTQEENLTSDNKKEDEVIGFMMDENEDIPDEDIKRMLFLFCVNENIPLHYKQLIGKIIKKDKYKKNEKIFIYNMIGYMWQMTKEEKDLTTMQKVIIIRKMHKLIFGKYDD